MDIEKLLPILYQKGLDVGTKIVGLLILWIIGRVLIGFIKKALNRSLEARSVEATLISYADSVVNVLLNILLVATMLGFVGVETTTFAGLLAAAGLAIGTAWSGLLSKLRRRCVSHDPQAVQEG
jgi:small conductance mechanosensitive channel